MRSKHYLNFRPTSRLYSRIVTTNALRLLWVLLILWGELGSFFWSISSCNWPAVQTRAGKALHILLLSDTQIQTPSLFSQSPSLYSSGFLADRFVRKSWYVASRLKPNVVFFLGDMLGNGKSVKNEAQYVELAQKFKSTFVLGSSASIHYMPGNNDVGMGLLAPHTNNIRAYYQKTFGPLNEVIKLNNHTFLALDAPALVDEDYQRMARSSSFDHWEPIPGGTVEAVRRVKAEHPHPLILLSHIPLHRPDSASCGPHREKGTIHRGVGHGYQNTLGRQTTAFLLKTLQPIAIFSGDNRDYCEYEHPGAAVAEQQGDVNPIPEVTVKSFSLSPKIRRPGFQLLSLADPTDLTPSDHQSLAHRSCLLPDQSAISSTYIWWSVSTLCALLILNVQRIRHFRLNKPPALPLTPSPSSNSNASPRLQDTDAYSPIWSPHTPFMPVHSLRTLNPSSFRTPIAPATPTFRASSRPMTPQDSPLHSPQLIPPANDDEDSMFPDQYIREIHRPTDEEWTPVGRDDFSENLSADEPPHLSLPPSQFISAPSTAGYRRWQDRGWSWSWTFVLRGRPRRITIRIPNLSTCWSSLKDMVDILRDADKRTLLRRRRGIFSSTLLESISVFWPAAVLWLIINGWMF